MATNKRERDSSTSSSSSDEEIQKVGRQHRIKNVVNSESDDNDSDIDVKPRHKKKLRKIYESDSGTDKNVSSTGSQSDSPSRAHSGKSSNGKKSSPELSDGEQSEKCSICLCKFLGQKVSYPETCDHKFCSECLLEWAKKMNTCPIDRLRFRYVLIQNPEAPDLCERIYVEDRRRSGIRDGDTFFQIVCELCGEDENLLVCARCLLGYHSVCLRLPSQPDPEHNEIWHCPYCAYLVLHEGHVPDNIYIGDSFHTLLRISFRRNCGEENQNLWLSNFYRLIGLTPPSSIDCLSSTVRLFINENSSSDSSDESTEELSSSNDRRQQCEAIRNRRQKRTSERLRARVLNTLSNSSAHGPSSSTSSRPYLMFTLSDSSDDSDYGFQDHGDVLSSFPCRTPARSKSMASRLLNLPRIIRPLLPPSLDPDILEDIRIIQANCPNSSSNDDAPLRRNHNDIGRQHPVNPAQNSSSGSSRSTFPSSSSSSATSGSSLYDLYNVPGCSMLANNAAAEGYDTDACSMVTHRSYGNSSQQEDSKRDVQDSLHMKDSRKSQSDDEVDIYSDIEYANDDASIDTDVLQIQSSFKPDESHVPPDGDGTDSSDNDLVIDEDLAVEEDASKTCIDKETSNVLTDQISSPESENSCSSIMEGEPTSESNALENIQSPDPLDNANQDGDWQANNESEENSEPPMSGNKSAEFEIKTYVDTDADSRDDNDVHCDDHSQNSYDFKENVCPKSPLNENSLSPCTDEVIAEDDASMDVTEQTSSPTEITQRCIAEVAVEEDAEANETDELMNETNFVKSDNTEEDECNNRTEDDECNNRTEDDECNNRTEDDECNNRTEDDECNNRTEDDECNNRTEDDECNNRTEDEDCDNRIEDEECDNKIEDEECDNKIEDEECNRTEDEECNRTEDEESNNRTEDEEGNYKTEDEEGNYKTEDEDCNKTADGDCNNKMDDEKDYESDENNECVNSDPITVNNSPANSISPNHQSEGTSNNFSSTKTFTHSTTPYFTENPTTGLKEFPTKASLKECLPIKGEFENKEHLHEKNSYQNIDLGIEDISDAASDDLNQLDNDTPEPMECEIIQDSTLHDVEKNVAKLFGPEDAERSPVKSNRKHRKDDFCEGTSNDSKRYISSRQALIDDQEEGEIIEDIPYQRKGSLRRGHFIHEDDEYMDSALRISNLPRIPKIKRESKSDISEELPLEAKRTSVLGRVDLGSSDIGWKRLSKHTRERSYRDGRPKDDNLLFRERELKSKDRNRKHASSERKNEQKAMEPERRRDDKKQIREESSKERNHSHDRRSEKSKSDYEKSSKSDWSYPDKKDKEKHSKHKDRHDRDKTKKDRHESKKDRHEKSKEKNRREDSKHDREKFRTEEKYAREVERFHQKEETYDRIYEKPREKEHKHKHKDSKSDSTKKCKDEKHKRTHSREYFSEKREREVRKVDDKLKIVVEHKESRSKDRSDKLADKRDSKHEKKHREIGHHYERKKKELSPVSYTELTPIESKEIFAKGDSIIINVNFNRASPREVVSSANEDFNHEKKSCDVIKADGDAHGCKLTHSSLDPDKKSDPKRPTTPLERNNQHLSSDDYYWQGGDETNAKSPIEEKGANEKIFTVNDESSNSPVNDFGADDNVTDSEDDGNLPETQPVANLPKEEDLDISISSKKGLDDVFGESEEKEFGSSRRRSPLHPPSPPDNDSYDPCEPTKSPSPPPLPNPPSPPLPSTGGTSDRPKPPPSPELPPLPPEPEPTDTLFQEDGKQSAQCSSMDSTNVKMSSPAISQLTEHHNSSNTESVVSAPGVLLPPPRFMGHVSHQNVSTMQSQITPSKTTTWQTTNPPPSTVIFQSNHMQPVIPANFLPTHIPTVGFAPPHVSATVLPPNSSIPLNSQVRHLQLGPHSVVPTNSLLSSVPINHLTLPQVQLSHPPLPNASVSVAMHQQHHPVLAMQAHPGNLPNSMASHCAGVNLISVQNQLSNVAVSLQSQHGNLISAHHPQGLTQLFPSQNQTMHSVPLTSQKSEKLSRSSPAKDRSEVIDMDVDSPYSPGDSPSMDSAYDYSPPSSPAYQDSAPVAAVKDAFDSLFEAEQAAGSQTEKTSGKGHSHSNCGERERKKQKMESKSEAAKNRHHSVRLQVDKVKSRKEQKLSERKDILSKLDDSQLTILDELPSSAVEMQVKEKFLKKLNRQERVVEEVKLALKPYYKTREVSKEEYKDILRKSVPKICHNKSGEINPQKVKYFIDSYVKKLKHNRKRSSKKRKSSKLS